MSIPGHLYQDLHAALLAAFTRDELSRFVRTRLDANFEALTADKNLSAQVDEVLRWAERAGRLRDLAEYAAAERPRNAALQGISAELDKLPAAAFAPRLPGDGWRVPFPRNEQFVGRGDDLAALHTAVQQGAAVGIRPAGLTGLGGIGKTQLAVEYCYHFRDAYPGGVFWLNAAGEWLPAFAELGRFLDEELDGKALDRQARAVADYFAAHPNSLLVLDNVQDPALLRVPVTPKLTPAHLPCRMIFTTRRRDLGDAFTPVELSVLPQEPGLCLLLRHPTRQPARDPAHANQTAAVDIYRILGGLPLALEIAGAHLGRLADRPIAAYRDELLRRGALAVVDDPRGKVNVTHLGTRHAAAVAATLAEQWDGLQSDDARLLLRVAGQFAEAEVIPAPRLGLLASISDSDEGFFGAPLALALDELHDAALVEKLAGDAIRLHPLVRDFAARRTPPDEVDALRNTCAANLLSAYRDFATLEDHCARRGVEALEADLLAALAFAAHDPSLQSPISTLLRMLQRDSHTLRGWDAAAEPNRFAQQWLKRALIEGDIPMQDQARCGLRHAPYLEATWLVAHTDKALERTLSKFGAGVIAAIATPDGRRIISASSDGLASKDETLTVWNLATGQEERTLTLRDVEISSIVVTPDRQRVIVASSGRTLKIWNIGNGAEERSLEGEIDDIMAMGMTRDGRWLITASSSGAMQAWVFATNSSHSVARYSAVGRSRYLNTVVVAAHAQHVIYPSNVDFNLQITDLATGLEYMLPGDASTIDVVATTPDGGTIIAALRSGALKVWEPATGREFKLHEEHPNVTALALFADGQRAISGSSFGELAIWDLPSGQKKATLIGHAGRINSVVVTADGQRAISASADATLKVWNLATVTGKIDAGGFHGWIHAVAVTAHGRVIASAEDGALKMWNLSTGAEEHPLLGHMGRVTVMAATTDGRIALGTGERTLKFWNPVGREDAPIVTVEQIDIAGDIVAVAPGGAWVIAAEGDRLEILNRETHVRSRLLGIRWDRFIKLGVAATRDGRVVAGSIDGTLKMWEPETLKVDHIMTEPGAQVTAAAVTPDGQRVIAGSSHGRLSIWDRAHGEMMASILLEAGVTCVAVAPDGVTLVAGDAAGNVYCLRYQETTADSGKQRI